MLGFTKFISLEQEMLVKDVCDGLSVIGILPTGGGKSAVYIIPTIERDLTTLVISPLKSLMEDQALKLRKVGVCGIACHSGLEDSAWDAAVQAFRDARGTPRLLFAAPEMVLSKRFVEHFGGVSFDLLAVDEAHCASTWGDAFRPNYLRIKQIARRLGKPQTVALSATIDEKILGDVKDRVFFVNVPVIVVRADPFRPNLELSVEKPGNNQKKVEDRNRLARHRLMELLDGAGPAIVYCWTRNGTFSLFDKLGRALKARGYLPILYHAKIGERDKEQALGDFLQHPKPVVFATNAFGMGIDRPDVRLLVHFDPPSTLVDYAQQIGRAGRDGLPARCVVFHHASRIERVSNFRDFGLPTAKFVEMVYARLVYRYQKLAVAERHTFNVNGIFTQMQYAARKQISDKNELELYLQRLVTSQSLLYRIGAIVDGEGGFEMYPLTPGSKRHLQLLEETRMTGRKEHRETKRVLRFLEAPNPTQELLWKTLRG
ncbi:DEAD/DEAH box helicase [Patescibacteria group bacterium]|jgi:ATP-dependent DNA helicase RecQ|nr:DEAD/DEAH box helicase [Patescibacteria group bacterium]